MSAKKYLEKILCGETTASDREMVSIYIEKKIELRKIFILLSAKLEVKLEKSKQDEDAKV